MHNQLLNAQEENRSLTDQCAELQRDKKRLQTDKIDLEDQLRTEQERYNHLEDAKKGVEHCLHETEMDLEREKRDKAELGKKRATLEALARTNKIQIEEIEKANADLASLVKVSE